MLSKMYAKAGAVFPTNCGALKQRVLEITDDHDY